MVRMNGKFPQQGSHTGDSVHINVMLLVRHATLFQAPCAHLSSGMSLEPGYSARISDLLQSGDTWREQLMHMAALGQLRGR